MKLFFNKYKHAWILSYFFLYVPWFLYLEKKVVTNYTVVELGIDQYIPFNELFLIPYMVWFLYIAVVVAYLFFMDKENYYKCCSFLFIGMTICLIIYTIWPNGQHLRPNLSTVNDSVLVSLVQKLYLTDTPTNVCPSIHVFNSIGVHIALCHSERLKKHKMLLTSSFILAVLISLSTVFLKQHSVFDGLCSIVLSIFMYLVVYKIDYSSLLQRYREKKNLLAIDEKR